MEVRDVLCFTGQTASLFGLNANNLQRKVNSVAASVLQFEAASRKTVVFSMQISCSVLQTKFTHCDIGAENY